MIKYFDIVETVRIKYRCNLPDIEGYTVKQYAEEYGMGEVFENSSHEEIIDYIDSDESTIDES